MGNVWGVMSQENELATGQHNKYGKGEHMCAGCTASSMLCRYWRKEERCEMQSVGLVLYSFLRKNDKMTSKYCARKRTIVLEMK